MAKQLAKLLEPHAPMFIEEPLLMEHAEGIKQLAYLIIILIAVSECLYSRWDVKPSMKFGPVDILQPDLAHAGGISEVIEIATIAEAYNVAIAPHSPLSPITLAVSMQIALS